MFGKRVPVTVHLQPFQEEGGVSSPFAGQEIVVMDARFGIQETRTARSANTIVSSKVSKTYVEINAPGTSMGSWPQSRNGWKRTVHVTMPSSSSSALDQVGAAPTRSKLTASLNSKYYDITHQLVVMLKVRTSGEKDRQAENVEIRRKFIFFYFFIFCVMRFVLSVGSLQLFRHLAQKRVICQLYAMQWVDVADVLLPRNQKDAPHVNSSANRSSLPFVLYIKKLIVRL
jgi:hypothetical protein